MISTICALCLYICEYVRTFVLGTLKIKLRSDVCACERRREGACVWSV